MKKTVISRVVMLSVLSCLASGIFTAVIILSTGLKSITTEDGIYAVKDGQMIELKGNAELKLYNIALDYLEDFPSGKILHINSEYSHFIKGTTCPDLVYHNGVLDGDFYQISVSLIETKKDALIFDSLYCSAGIVAAPGKLSFPARENLVQMATEGMVEKIN